MDELEEHVRRGAVGGACVCCTFDDGFADNVAHGLPVLRAHSAPFVVYACTEFAARALRARVGGVDVDVHCLDALLEAALLAGDAPAAFPHPATPRPLPASTLDEKRAALHAMWAAEAADADAYASAAVAFLAARGVDPAAAAAEQFLGWDDLRALAAEPLATVASHTRTHRRLRRLPDEQARDEIFESRRRLEQGLGRPVRHLAYPFGGPGECGPREFALAREAGYATAVTTRRGNVFAEHRAHLTALPRVAVSMFPHSANVRYVRAALSGARNALMNRMRRVVVE
jgi:peptidoglycan/xylan/chitin deacetylase (PgdA/CDA1 family)